VVSLEMRILACGTSKGRSVAKRRNTDPFQIPVCDLAAMEVLQTLGCLAQLLSHVSGGSGIETAEAHTSSSLLV